MEPVRVLQVLANLNRGGAETMIMNLYRRIDREKVQFDFLIHTPAKCDYEDEVISLGGRVFRAPQFKIYNTASYKKWLSQFFAEHKELKIIHGHQYNTASIYLEVAKKNDLVTISHSHNTSNGSGLSSVVKNYMHRNLYKIPDYRFACSKEAGEWLFRNKADFTFFPNAIDTSLFGYNEEIRNRVRKEFGVSENDFLVGHVGRFCTQKNHKRLLKIFAKIKEINGESKLLLIGQGALCDEIKTLAETLGIADSVIFAGLRNNVNELLQGMDVFLFPSLHEGLPVTLVEAQSTGLRCVISDVISDDTVIVKELISKVSLDDSDETWAEECLKTDSERRDRCDDIKKSGFDITESAKRLEEFYLGLQ